MAKKLMAKTGPLGRAFNETGNVGHNKALLKAGLNHAKLWGKGGKRVVGHLGPGIGGRGNQRGLARIGQSE